MVGGKSMLNAYTFVLFARKYNGDPPFRMIHNPHQILIASLVCDSVQGVLKFLPSP